MPQPYQDPLTLTGTAETLAVPPLLYICSLPGFHDSKSDLEEPTKGHQLPRHIKYFKSLQA